MTSKVRLHVEWDDGRPDEDLGLFDTWEQAAAWFERSKFRTDPFLRTHTGPAFSAEPSARPSAERQLAALKEIIREAFRTGRNAQDAMGELMAKLIMWEKETP